MVSKVLRTLTTDFDHVVAAIEESKDLSIYCFDELMALLGHEFRMNRSSEKVEEKAFQVEAENSSKRKSTNSNEQGKDRGDYHGRSRGSGKGRSQFGEQHQFQSNIQCRYWKKIGHKEAEYWSKRKMKQREPTLLRKLQKKVICSWPIL